MRKENKEKVFEGNEDFFEGQQEDFVQQRINAPRRFLSGLLRKLETKPRLWALLLGILLFFGGIFTDVFLVWAVFFQTDSTNEPVFVAADILFFSLLIAVDVRLGIAIIRGFYKAKARDKIIISILALVSLLVVILVCLLALT